MHVEEREKVCSRRVWPLRARRGLKRARKKFVRAEARRQLAAMCKR